MYYDTFVHSITVSERIAEKLGLDQEEADLLTDLILPELEEAYHHGYQDSATDNEYTNRY